MRGSVVISVSTGWRQVDVADRRCGRRCRARSARRGGVPSASHTNTESPVPVRWMARTQSARLVPGGTVTGWRRLRTRSRSSVRDGTRRATAPSVRSVTLESVVRPCASDGSRALASLPAHGSTTRRGHRAGASCRPPATASGSMLAAPDLRHRARLARRSCGWRFLIGAALGWAWVLASPRRRACSRDGCRAGRSCVALALGALFTGNAGTYYAGLETVPAALAGVLVYTYPVIVARPVAAVRDAPAGAPTVGRARAGGGRGRRWRSAGSTSPTAPPVHGPAAGPRVGLDLLGLDHPVGAAVRGAARPTRQRAPPASASRPGMRRSRRR